MSLKLAPRITVYRSGTPLPSMEEGWLALAQLPRNAAGPAAFGDGSHPTTRLCAAAVDLLCRQRQPRAVLDVGTGTGVLARIARARGAQFIVGTDIDPLALCSATAHSDLDTHPVQIHFSDKPPDHWGDQFDLVVANILEGPLQHLAAALSGALVPGGVLLLSGFTRPQTPALRVVYEKVGVTFIRESCLEEWAMLMFER